MYYFQIITWSIVGGPPHINFLDAARKSVGHVKALEVWATVVWLDETLGGRRYVSHVHGVDGRKERL